MTLAPQPSTLVCGVGTAAEIIEFENANPRPCPKKHDLIMRRFGITPTRYYQALSLLMESAEGVQLDPQLASRVRRHRERHEARRAARRAQRAP